VTSSWFFLSTLNDDARSTTRQNYFCSILCHAAEDLDFCVYKKVTTRGKSSCITQTEQSALICQLLHAIGK